MPNASMTIFTQHFTLLYLSHNRLPRPASAEPNSERLGCLVSMMKVKQVRTGSEPTLAATYSKFVLVEPLTSP